MYADKNSENLGLKTNQNSTVLCKEYTTSVTSSILKSKFHVLIDQGS